MLMRRGFATLAVSAALIGAASGQTGQPMLGEPAPLFELPGVQGETVSLQSLRGKLVVIHFGASW